MRMPATRGFGSYILATALSAAGCNYPSLEPGDQPHPMYVGGVKNIRCGYPTDEITITNDLYSPSMCQNGVLEIPPYGRPDHVDTIINVLNCIYKGFPAVQRVDAETVIEDPDEELPWAVIAGGIQVSGSTVAGSTPIYENGANGGSFILGFNNQIWANSVFAVTRTIVHERGHAFIAYDLANQGIDRDEWESYGAMDGSWHFPGGIMEPTGDVSDLTFLFDEKSAGHLASALAVYNPNIDETDAKNRFLTVEGFCSNEINVLLNQFFADNP